MLKYIAASIVVGIMAGVAVYFNVQMIKSIYYA